MFVYVTLKIVGISASTTVSIVKSPNIAKMLGGNLFHCIENGNAHGECEISKKRKIIKGRIRKFCPEFADQFKYFSLGTIYTLKNAEIQKIECYVIENL